MTEENADKTTTSPVEETHNDTQKVNGINEKADTNGNLDNSQELMDTKAALTPTDNDNDTNDVSTVEDQQKKIPYPKSIFFIISNEFCERFNYYGMRTILVLYLNRQLNFSPDTSTVIFHIFTMLVYFLCVFGAILSDSWLGKFKTIFYLSLVYVCGSIMVTLGAVPPLNLPGTTFTMIGLALIALGSGGIKPCVAAFGGDQFKLPEQIKQMTWFFSLFYFSINSGSLISTTITPILREDVHCFGEKECYSLAFGVPAILMTVSIIIFVLGRPLYKSKPPAGNMLVLVSKTIGNAIVTKCKEKKTNPREHWLDYADKKHDRQLIEDTKVLMRVLVLYLPLPVFWALFDQQGSRWTFQATRMDGDMGSWNIKPDQAQMINPLLILVFIPLYDIVFYPLLRLVGIRRPLQKLTMGGILAGIAFIISAIVELNLEKTYPVLPTNNFAQLRIFNGENCNYTFYTNIDELSSFQVPALNVLTEKNIPIKDKEFLLSYEMEASSPDCPTFDKGDYLLKQKTAISLFVNSKNNTHPLYWYEDSVDKPLRGSPLARTLANVNTPREIVWRNKKKNSVELRETSNLQTLHEFNTGDFAISVDDKPVTEVTLKIGAVYTLLIDEVSTNSYESTLVEVTAPNSVNILWIIPQYVVLTLGEVMFSVTGLEFSYSQAPVTMKSVLQACWLLAVAFGNVIVVIIAELKLFESQANEFFLFAGLMFIDMIIFALIAMKYKPNNPTPVSETEPLYDPKHEIKELDMGIDNKAKQIDD